MNEFTIREWLAYRAKMRRVGVHLRRARHECRGGECGRVFRCRSRGGHYACGRYVGACVGGDDNRCSACWLQLNGDVA
jgi:hypothetical protein